MLPDPVSNPGPLTYESGTLPIALQFYISISNRKTRVILYLLAFLLSTGYVVTLFKVV